MTYKFTSEPTQEQRERAMYGMTEQKLRDLVERHIFPGDSGLMFAAGLLSDIQEILSCNDCDDADQMRQILNQAKFIIFDFMDKRNIR
jgi:hypothetical protein